MPSDDRGSGLEAALDELFGSDPAEFVATRKRLARELRTAGDSTAARQVEAARRPTKPAWALNALARRHPDLIRDLLDRSDELRAAQTRALAGSPGSQRDATRTQRRTLTDAADAAVAILGASGEAARAEILSTLQGAAVDEHVGSILRAGRFERTEVAATGFPGVGSEPPDELAERRSRRSAQVKPAAVVPKAGADGPVGPARHESDPRAKAAAREAERRRERERQQAEARQRAAAAIEGAEEAVRTATAEAEAAVAGVVQAEARVAALQAEVEAARLELRRAKDRVAATAREVSRRTRDVERRRRALDAT
jgi:hypothetical protein